MTAPLTDTLRKHYERELSAGSERRTQAISELRDNHGVDERFQSLNGHSAPAEETEPKGDHPTANGAGTAPPVEPEIEFRDTMAHLGKRLLLTRDDWRDSAAQFTRWGHQHLMYFKEEFLEYKKGAYRVVEDAAIRSDCRWLLDNAAVRVPKKGKRAEGAPPEFDFESFRPNTKDVSELFNAVADYQHIPADRYSPPAWLPAVSNAPPANECISLQNCILHAPSMKVVQPTPYFFTLNVLSFDFDPKATCPLWEKTLDDYWPRVNGAVAQEVLLLQEIAGYLLLPWTSLHKIFFFIGSGRNGKGTVTRVLKALIGAANVAAPSASNLADPKFGRESLIGKLVAIVGEMQFGRNDDASLATSFLKQVSGEDDVNVGRKFKGDWIGVLPTRFLMVGNKVPGLIDDSPALAERIVALRFTRQFLDKPDTELSRKLEAELPGIFNWALKGYARLRVNGRFTLPDSSRDLADTIKRVASGVEEFIEDCCKVDPAEVEEGKRGVVTEQALYTAYRAWAERKGGRPMNKTDFVEAMSVAMPAVIAKYRPRAGDKMGARSFRGIALGEAGHDRDTFPGM